MNNISTHHIIYNGLAQNMSNLDDNSIDLVVTSPPYPMIEMWDEIMAKQNEQIAEALSCNDGLRAFELMHIELDRVWQEVSRVVKDGGFVCVNIGDATRSIDGKFSIYSNHSRIIDYFQNNGFTCLPNIIWRKQTNSPNKFMGSGMLPAGAYVTLEHEWILIFRKGDKREFKSEQSKQHRRESAYFWEERNRWFSDMWSDIKGVKQSVLSSNSRDRSAAYPFEIPYRLINMFSVQGDIVLDPFMGTGTTAIAAIASNRNSVGYEVDEAFVDAAIKSVASVPAYTYNNIIANRVEAHNVFVNERLESNKEIKHYNKNLSCPVVTAQERDLDFKYISYITATDKSISVEYTSAKPQMVRSLVRRRVKLAVNDTLSSLFSN